MKMKLLTGIFLLLFAAACGSADNFSNPLNLDIQLRVEPENPSIGESMLYIEIRDSGGQAIRDAELRVVGNMSHEGMATVEANSNINENGIYTIPFEWTMGGDWFLDVTVTLANNGGTFEKRFEVFVNAVSENSIIHQTPSSEDD